MKNRGYKYVIKKNSMGYMLLCINATWINQLLKDRGIRPKDFRKLTYEDLAAVQTVEYRKRLFTDLKPKNFWEMCDTFALAYAEYDINPGEMVYQKAWFYKYHVFTVEDVYEILMQHDFQQEDALRIAEFARRGRCSTLRLSSDEFMQLYDVPEGLQEVLKKCKYIPPRDKVIHGLLDTIERAIYVRGKREVRDKESI